MPAAGWTKMSAEDIRLASEWYDAGESCSEIADNRERNKSAITRLLVKQVERRPQGRPRLITNAKLAFLKRSLKELVQKADAHYTVTVTMLKKACKDSFTRPLSLSTGHIAECARCFAQMVCCVLDCESTANACRSCGALSGCGVQKDGWQMQHIVYSSVDGGNAAPVLAHNSCSRETMSPPPSPWLMLLVGGLEHF